ncbi:MAG TPA: flagellar assembly protein A [Gallionella sp.]|nr:flagellar assembly protein A [Gallionella sp.]
MTASDSTNESKDVLREQLVTPGFVAKRAEGVFIQLQRLQTNGDFELFVDRLFGEGMRFAGLDYATFLKLLYDADWLADTRSKIAEIKVAEELVRFQVQRRALYRPVKILEGGARAEYVFEPVSIEVSYEEPVYGEPDADGVAQIVRYASKTREQPARLDFDEFVADMWLKGVKFGIDADAMRMVVARGTSVRMIVAKQLEPTEGSDAEILEVSEGLRRDNAPKLLANGKVDLAVFANRFPQMAKGSRLLKKVPRVLGKQGHKVTGEVIEPKIPNDLDLSALSSEGTRVEQFPDGEYIVATLDGFLTLDTKSNTVSITEKIENKAGISVKTTGNLSLSVDEFIEHGEVQEGRVVQGKHMTFLSDVFGKIVSQGGNIRIDGNLSGGQAHTQAGNVTLNGRVSRAVVRAKDGEVVANFCESSTIVGSCVRIEHAVNCEIVADEVHAGTVEGCSIAAKKVQIASADERRGRETLVTLMVPDFSTSDQFMAKLQKEIAAARQGIEERMRKIEGLKSEPEFAKFLALAERIKSGAIKLTQEQAGNWRKLMERHAKASGELAKLDAEIKALDQSLKESEEELSYTERDRAEMGEGIACVINKVVGQTTGQTMASASGLEIFGNMSGNDIRNILQKSDGSKARIFSADDGSIDWLFKGTAVA